MNNKNKTEERKKPGKGRSSDKRKTQASKHDEDFNTGSHSPTSLRKVGPGYDDTGMGSGSKSAAAAKKVQRPQRTIKGNTQRMRSIIKSSAKSRS